MDKSVVARFFVAHGACIHPRSCLNVQSNFDNTFTRRISQKCDKICHLA